MEEEAYFLFVIWNEKYIEKSVNSDGYMVYDVSTNIRRATVQKGIDRDEFSKRIQVDFEFLDKKIVFVLVMFLEQIKEDRGTYCGVPAIVGLFDNEEDALTLKNKISPDNHRKFHDKKGKTKFIECEIIPTIVSRM